MVGLPMLTKSRSNHTGMEDAYLDSAVAIQPQYIDCSDDFLVDGKSRDEARQENDQTSRFTREDGSNPFPCRNIARPLYYRSYDVGDGRSRACLRIRNHTFGKRKKAGTSTAAFRKDSVNHQAASFPRKARSSLGLILPFDHSTISAMISGDGVTWRRRYLPTSVWSRFNRSAAAATGILREIRNSSSVMPHNLHVMQVHVKQIMHRRSWTPDCGDA